MNLQELTLRRSTPVVINSFNQNFYLKKIVNKFLDEGFINLIIVDNNSSDPELLKYLNKIGGDKRVLPIQYGENHGPRYFFEEKLYQLMGGIPFIYSDPDISWDKFSDDFVTKFLSLSNKYSCAKVGCALTLPKKNEIKEGLPKIKVQEKEFDVVEFESRYWLDKIEDNVYISPVDTTLHLFNPVFFNDEKNFFTGIRVAGEGYEVKHMPWFSDDPCPSEEIKNYRDTDIGWRNWV